MMALSGDTVTVGCSVVGGVRAYGLGTAVGLPVTDANNNILFAGPTLVKDGLLLVGGANRAAGCGFTTVPTEIWQAWLDANTDSPLIASGAVFQAS
jgi:hypothetical protein